MDFLNKAYDQLKDLLFSMTPAARITTGLLLAIVVVSVIYLFQANLTGGDEYLLGARAFSNDEIQKIQAACAKAGLEKCGLEGNRVKIPRGKSAAYIGAMADAKALPPNFNEMMDEALSSSNPFESREKQQARLKNAKQKELSLILCKMKDIEEATVQYDITEKRSFPRTKIATAMVAVRPVGGMELDHARIRSIRYLVASSIAELNPENVTVHDLNGEIHNSTSIGAIEGEGSDYAVIKRLYEKDWSEKVRKALSPIPGVIVAANVELDPQMKRTEQGEKLDPNGVAIHSIDRTKENNSTTPMPAGRPGVAAQGIMSPGGVNREESRDDSTETYSEVEKISAREAFVTTRASLVPKEVTVTVSVPSAYYLDVWEQRNPSRDGQPAAEPATTDLQKIEDEVKTNIEEIVVGLLPQKTADEDQYPRVKVTTYQSLAKIEPSVPTGTSKAVSWLGDNWSTLGMIFVGLFGLLMLRSMVRSTPAPTASDVAEAPPSLGIVSPEDSSSEGEEEKENNKVLRRSFVDSGPNLKEELTEMVRESPDAAATILRSWIGSAT